MIALSDLYQVSLDVLLKGSADYMQHLNESTDVVKSNKLLIRVVLFALLGIFFVLAISRWIPF